MGVSGWMFLLVPAYPGCPGSKAVKRSLLLLLLLLLTGSYSHITQHCVFVLGYVSISIGPCCSQMHATVNCKIHRCHHSNVMWHSVPFLDSVSYDTLQCVHRYCALYWHFTVYLASITVFASAKGKISCASTSFLSVCLSVLCSREWAHRGWVFVCYWCVSVHWKKTDM